MSKSDSDSDSDSSSIDPRLETSFGSRFENIRMDVDDLGEIMADLHDDGVLHSVLMVKAHEYIEDEHPEIGRLAQKELAELIAKEAKSGLFPYRNALVDAETADIRPGDRVFKKLEAREGGRDEAIVREYEVQFFDDHGTEAVLRTIAEYEPNGDLIREPWKDIVFPGTDKFREQYMRPNVAQLRYDNSYVLHEAPRGEDDE